MENVKSRAVPWTLGFLLVAALLFAGYTWLSLTWAYAKGERAGYIQKFSKKGYVCKTWEGELAMVAVPGSMPEMFYFSVRDDAVAAQRTRAGVEIKGRSPLALQGALVLQAKQCRNCHSLGEEGGMRGPALDSVATRLTRDQLIRQVLQGGGNMPAYGNNLRPDEVTALVAFMDTLRPTYEPGARDSAGPAR